MIDIYLMAVFFISGFIGLGIKLKLFKISNNEKADKEFHKKYDKLALRLAISSYAAFGIYLYEYLYL